MRVQATALYYEKSEHTSETNEDRYASLPGAGLFAVADGVGTASFSRLWADILVERFVHEVPLVSVEPFEVQWWLQQAQVRFTEKAPPEHELPWYARAKAKEGAQSTFAGLRFTAVDKEVAHADLIVFGDSCIIVRRPGSEKLHSFPYQLPDDFAKAPICLPSSPRIFNRTFHRGNREELTLSPDDTIILGTDAVSKWILSIGDNELGNSASAHDRISRITPEEWPAFLGDLRERARIVDDDSTVLIVRLLPDSAKEGEPLGCTSGLSPNVMVTRRRELAEALLENNAERILTIIGDPELGVDVEHRVKDLERLRSISDAKVEMLTELRRALKSDRGRTSEEDHRLLQSAWDQRALLLIDEPSAAKLRESLQQFGIRLAPAPASSTTPETHPSGEHSNKGAKPPAAKAEEPDRRVAQQHPPPPPRPAPATATPREPKAPAPAHAAPTKVIPEPPSAGADQALLKLHEAIKTDDDDKILLAWNSGFAKKTSRQDSPGVDDQARARIELAHTRVGALLKFRQGLTKYTSPDRRTVTQPGALLEAYDAQLLDGYPKLVEAERQTVAIARAIVAIDRKDDSAICDAVKGYDGSELDGLLSRCTADQKQQIHRAQMRMSAHKALVVAIQSDSDEQIALYKGQLDESNLLTPVQRARIDLACHRIGALSRFRQALGTEIDEQIVEAYEPILDSYSTVTPVERQRLEEARRRDKGVADLLQALASDDDLSIEAAAGACPEALNSRRLTPEQRQQVDLARDRKSKLSAFQDVLAKGDDAQIASEYHGLSQALRERLRPDDLARAETATHRQEAVGHLRDALKTNDDARIVEVWEAYKALLETAGGLAPEERERARQASIDWARKIVDVAIQHDDDREIVDVCAAHLVAGKLTPEQENRRVRAEKAMAALRQVGEILEQNSTPEAILSLCTDLEQLALAFPRLTPEQSQKLFGALHSMLHLWNFQRAIRYEDPGEILRAYDPCLREFRDRGIISEEEWTTYERARQSRSWYRRLWQRARRLGRRS